MCSPSMQVTLNMTIVEYNLIVGCNWHFNLGIDSIAHECVASGTKNALIVGTPNSILSTGDQGVLVGTPIFNFEYW